MIIGRHVITHEIVVLADDQGLPVPMRRDAEGHWHVGDVDAMTLMEDVVPIRDPGERQDLLTAALQVYRHKHRVDAAG